MDVIEELGGVLMPIKQKRFNIFSCVPNRTPTLPAQATMVVGPPGWRSMNSDLGAKLHGLASCLILSVYVYRLDECVCFLLAAHLFQSSQGLCRPALLLQRFRCGIDLAPYSVTQVPLLEKMKSIVLPSIG